VLPLEARKLPTKARRPQTASRRLALTQLTAPVRRLRRPSTVSRRSCEVIKEVVEEAIMNEK
jgi:hypothetical protein